MRRVLLIKFYRLVFMHGMGFPLRSQAVHRRATRLHFSGHNLPKLPDAFGFGGPFVGTQRRCADRSRRGEFSQMGCRGRVGQKVWNDQISVLQQPEGNVAISWRSCPGVLPMESRFLRTTALLLDWRRRGWYKPLPMPTNSTVGFKHAKQVKVASLPPLPRGR